MEDGSLLIDKISLRISLYLDNRKVERRVSRKPGP